MSIKYNADGGRILDAGHWEARGRADDISVREEGTFWRCVGGMYVLIAQSPFHPCRQSPDICMQSDCTYAELSFSEFLSWLRGGQESREEARTRLQLPEGVTSPSEYWGYADYKREDALFGGAIGRNEVVQSTMLGSHAAMSFRYNFWACQTSSRPMMTWNLSAGGLEHARAGWRSRDDVLVWERWCQVPVSLR